MLEAAAKGKPSELCQKEEGRQDIFQSAIVIGGVFTFASSAVWTASSTPVPCLPHPAGIVRLWLVARAGRPSLICLLTLESPGL